MATARAAVEARQRGDLNGAAAGFESLTQKAPELQAAWLNLGLVRHEQGRVDAAIAALENALRIGPANPEASQLLGFNLVQAERHAEALEHLAAAAEAKPSDVALRELLAQAYLSVAQQNTADGDLTAALGAYEEAARLSPGTRGVRRTIGDLQAELAELDSAVASYRQELTLGPDALTLTRLGDALLQTGRADDAIEPLRKAVEQDPEAPAPPLLLAKALADTGELREAIALLIAMIESEPDVEWSGKAHYALVTLYRRAGDSDGARRHMAAFREMRRRSGAPE